MFTAPILKVVAAHIQQDMAGQRITVQNEDLKALCARTEIIVPKSIYDNSVEDRTQSIAEQLLQCNENNVQSEEFITKLAESYSRKLDAVVDFTKNTVIPTTTDLANIIYTILDDAKSDSKGLVDVCPVSVPGFAKTILNAHKSKVTKNPPSPPESRLPYMSIPMATLFTQTGKKQLNDMVLEWVSNSDKEQFGDYLKQLYDTVKDKRRLNVYLTKLSPYQRVEFALVALTTVGNVVTSDGDFGRLENVSTLSSFKAEMETYAAHILSVNLNLIDSLKKRNTVIVRSEVTSEVIADLVKTPKFFVDSEMYSKYLEQGGTKEALIGRAMSTGRESTIEQLLPKTLSYMTVYRRNSRISEKLTTRRILTVLHRELKSVVRDLHAKIIADDVYTSAIPDNAIEAIDQYVLNLGSEDIKDLTTVAKTIVAGILLANSPASKILSNMEIASTDGTDDVDECAFLAVTDYLLDYVAEGLTLESSMSDIPLNLI